MSWKSHHRRGEVLREVVRVADERRDGLLPMDVDGVADTFRDELTLLGALQLRWHTRLAGRIERDLADQPLDLEAAVVGAWVVTAQQMPGVRAVLDRQAATTTAEASDGIRAAMARATAKEHELLALMSGRASGRGEATARVGATIADRARATYAATSAGRPGRHARTTPSLRERLRAVLAA